MADSPLIEAFGKDAVDRLENACGNAKVVEQAGDPDGVIRVELAWGKTGQGRVLIDRPAKNAHWANLDVRGQDTYKTMCAKLPRLWRSFGLETVTAAPVSPEASEALQKRGDWSEDGYAYGLRWVL